MVFSSSLFRKYSTNTRMEELEYPKSQTSNHHDLSSYLDYAARINLDRTSTSFIGTHYEYTAQTALKRLRMSLKHIGGSSDSGIDLIGTWKLPSAPQPLKVFISCKVSMKLSSQRELEGTFLGAPAGWRGPAVLGLLVSPLPATKGVREAIGLSRWPMGYVCCKPEGRILQMMWNRRAAQEGLEGINVELKYGGGDLTDREVILTWKGEAIHDSFEGEHV
jgi:hypothetical protein